MWLAKETWQSLIKSLIWYTASFHIKMWTKWVIIAYKDGGYMNMPMQKKEINKNWHAHRHIYLWMPLILRTSCKAIDDIYVCVICESVRASLLNWIPHDESVITWRRDSCLTLWCVSIEFMYTSCTHLDMMRTHPAETADTHTHILTHRGFPLWPPHLYLPRSHSHSPQRWFIHCCHVCIDSLR